MTRLFEPRRDVVATFSEQTALFISLIRWTILAIIVGVVVGTSTYGFVTLLQWSMEETSQFPYYYLGIPFFFLMSTAIVKWLAPDAEGHGTERIIEAVHKHSGKIRLRVVPVKLVATIITIAGGGSAGKEGPAAQIGGALASGFASILNLSERDRKKIVVCGISAGFASVFGTPVAGALFGIEVLFLGHLLYDVLVPSFIAGLTAYQVSASLGLTFWSHTVVDIPPLDHGYVLQLVLTGVVFGLVTVLFIEVVRLLKRVLPALWPNHYARAFVGGLIVVGLAMVFGHEITGLGTNHIERVFDDEQVSPVLWLGKILATAMTLESGGSGGIVTPIFFVGATFGSFWAGVIGANPVTMAALGTTSVLSGAANTPIAASMMAVEMFGPGIGPYAAGCAMVSFIMTGHRSIYPSQILSQSKSDSLVAPLNQPLASTVRSRLSSEGKEEMEKVTSLPMRIWGLLSSGIWLIIPKNKKDE